jgi:hypothetical protein
VHQSVIAGRECDAVRPPLREEGDPFIRTASGAGRQMKRSLFLALDVSTRRRRAGVLAWSFDRGVDLLCEMERVEGDDGAPVFAAELCRAACEKAGVSVAQLAGIAAGVGPGGTPAESVAEGLASLKLLARRHGLAWFEVSSLAALAVAAAQLYRGPKVEALERSLWTHASSARPLFLPMLGSARRTFLGFYGLASNGSVCCERADGALTSWDFCAALPLNRKLIGVGQLPPILPARLSADLEAPWAPRPIDVVRLALSTKTHRT